MIRPLKTKDKQEFMSYWGIENPKYLVNKIFKLNFPCYIMDNGHIDGFVLVTKVENEKQLLLVATEYKTAYKLMKYLLWHSKFDMYAHYTEWHPYINLLKKFGFRLYSTRESGKFDLMRKFDPKYYFPKKGKNYEYK